MALHFSARFCVLTQPLINVQETSRSKQRKNQTTVGSMAASAVAAKKKAPTHSFKLQRLVGIFQVC